MHSLSPGSLLHKGTYRIERVLGQGGFGITYLAYDINGKRHVAAKEFFFKDGCGRAADGSTVVVTNAAKKDLIERFRKKFIKEANLIKKLDHSDIIHVYDVFSENDTSYYIMEYIDGETLSSVIKAKGHLSESESLGIVKHVADALEYLHSRKINHLDIKPGNIMITRHDGKIILIDFGVSKQYDPESGEATTTTPVGLSHGYSPLEQYKPGGVSKFSPESDIYSLGATLFKMLSGVTPPDAVDIAHSGITDYPSAISPKIRKVLSVIMSPERHNRPHSIGEFNKVLKGEYVDEATSLERPIRTKGKTGLYILLAIVLCLIIGVSTYVLSTYVRQPGEPYIDIVTTDSVQEADTVVIEPVEELPKFTTHQMSKSEGNSSIKVDFPKCLNPVLQQNIREWINEMLGGTYEGDLNDDEAMFNHYANKLGAIDEGEGEYDKTSLTKAYEDDYVVTYKDASEVYLGGMHGIGTELGRTFRKSDGKLFTNSFLYFNDLKDHAVRGLKKYFNVSSDDELMDILLLDITSLDELPAPSNDPWIMGDGVHFQYTPYEIAAFSYGSPTFTVPISDIKPAVNATAKTFFN